jgi:hypothetical protein
MKVPSKFHLQRRFTYRGNYLTLSYVNKLKSDLASCSYRDEKEFFALRVIFLLYDIA